MTPLNRAEIFTAYRLGVVSVNETANLLHGLSVAHGYQYRRSFLQDMGLRERAPVVSHGTFSRGEVNAVSTRF